MIMKGKNRRRNMKTKGGGGRKARIQYEINKKERKEVKIIKGR